MAKGFSILEKPGQAELLLDGKTMMGMIIDPPMAKRSCPTCQKRTAQKVMYMNNENEQTIHLCSCGQLFYANKFGSSEAVKLAFFGVPAPPKK